MISAVCKPNCEFVLFDNRRCGHQWVVISVEDGEAGLAEKFNQVLLQYVA